LTLPIGVPYEIPGIHVECLGQFANGAKPGLDFVSLYPAYRERLHIRPSGKLLLG
jgi:hypothetical protein